MTKGYLKMPMRKPPEVSISFRCKDAGFDAIQLHGTHGYLIAQFLSPFTNRRPDKWGGNTENRMRFVKEVVKKVRAAVGPDYPVLIKISVEEGVDNGLTLDESCIIAKGLADEGKEIAMRPNANNGDYYQF